MLAFQRMTTATPAHDTPAQTPSQPMSLRTRLSAWSEIMQTANPPAELPLDTVGKWLVMTRAAVIPMTLWSGHDRPAPGCRIDANGCRGSTVNYPA